MTRLGLVSVALLAWSSVAQAQTPAPTVLKVDQGKSRLAYTVIHKLHTVVATSQKVEGGVQILPNGVVQVKVWAPVASFDSQNSGRDSHMQETMEATQFPYVTFKGVSNIAMPTTFPSTVKMDVKGELEFHGRKKAETVPVEVTFTSPTEAKAIGKFAVSLEKYEVERPSLMFIKINDACEVVLDLVVKQ